MTTQHVETLIIGAGQAGLATAYQLQRLGHDSLIVDEAARIGDNWRRHYDSLTLFTPAYANSLDGLPYPGEPWHFPTKDEFAEYLELYAVANSLPVRMQTRVERLADRDGGFVAAIGPDEITCDNVVVATGTFGRDPVVPALARELDARIHQIHSSEYRNPEQLEPGGVLVGAGSSQKLHYIEPDERVNPRTAEILETLAPGAAHPVVTVTGRQAARS